LAKNSVATIISRLLWAFDIKKKLDPMTGKPIEVDILDYAEGIVLCPNKFKADFILRGKEYEDTIRHELHEAIPQLTVYELGMDQSDVVYVEKMRNSL